MKMHCDRVMNACLAAALATAVAPYVQADVTVEQKSNLEVASMIKMHGASTTSITSDKMREDTESHCEGVMSLICGNLRGGEIVRLDKDVTWHLEPSKKRYREQAFTTPEELAAMRAKMQANLEKMRSCPVSQKQQPIDKSKCQMSPPKIDVHKTDDKTSIAGHEAQRTLATLTESCTDKDNGDVCDTVVAVDVWLTQDQVPGNSDRHAFYAAYAKKLGMDEPQNLMRGEAARFLAPYQSQIKQLTDKSADLKGLPLRTSLRVLVGGEHCSATTKSASGEASSTDSGSGSTAAPNANPLNNVTQAGKALGSMVGGLFHKKKADDSAPASAAAPADAAAPATPSAPDPFAKLLPVASFTLETVSISTDAIPANRFDVPADWTKEVPKQIKGGDEEFTCPKQGS
jgi:hypothetical protein